MDGMNPVPEYMELGSRGPHVSILHAFLFGALYGQSLVLDQDYGGETTKAVNCLQVDQGVGADGNFGPETRKMVKSDFSFDFAAACESVPGTTIFVQPDGSEIEWTSPAPIKLVVGINVVVSNPGSPEQAAETISRTIVD